jgi:competence protein ComEC
VAGEKCWHFDFGGERNPISEVKKYCDMRENLLILSHADRDHFSFIKSLRTNLQRICLYGPSWQKLNLKKVGAVGLPQCPHLLSPGFHFFLPKFKITKDDNINSQMIQATEWLLPGDAPQSLEKIWLRTTPRNLTRITKLVLGHHGSKTSTSLELLHHLSGLTQCIASSRTKKYGHPHRDVRQRIQKHCSLILTEDWNHLHYLLE